MRLIVILFLFEGLPFSPVVGERKCAKLNEKCKQTEDCCFGSCIADSCNDDLYKNNRDRSGSPPDPTQLISGEMSTGDKIDVSEHEHIKLIASLEECGESNRKHQRRRKRIVGGTSYELGKYPWAVSLHMNKIAEGNSVFHCGGSLISKRHVITAAHCVTRLHAGVMLKWVTLGNVDRRLKLECETNPASNSCQDIHYLDIEIENWVVHEAYSEAHVRNDIALIRLKEEVNYTEYIKPICLPRAETIFKKWLDGQMTVIGWGSQNDPEDVSPSKLSLVAQEVEHWLVHRSSCDRFFTRTIGLLRRSQICVGGYPGKGDCAGDSGGSLFKRLPMDEDESGESEESPEERFFLFGLVSTGAVTNCAREGRPSVYTNVIYYMPWILDHLLPRKDLHTEQILASHNDVVPKDEFATGFDPPMDVTEHKNIEMLPKFPDCGVIRGQQDHTGPASGPDTPNPAYHVRKKRVVGGIVQSVGTFPWMAQIYVRHVVSTEHIFRCGGMIITDRHILTGAHCVVDIRGPYALDGVILGNFNRKEKIECMDSDCVEQKAIPIEDYVTHEAFSKFAREHDVAIIKLSHAIPFDRFVQPICLPLQEDMAEKAWSDPNERKYAMAGWGRVTGEGSGEEDTALSNLLIGGNFTLESKKYCETTLVRKVGKLENSRICGGGTVPGRGECVGDTGAPMMRWVTQEGPDGQNYTRMFAFGILSVVECANQGIPSLYQNMLYHMPWIMDHLKF